MIPIRNFRKLDETLKIVKSVPREFAPFKFAQTSTQQGLSLGGQYRLYPLCPYARRKGKRCG